MNDKMKFVSRNKTIKSERFGGWMKSGLNEKDEHS